MLQAAANSITDAAGSRQGFGLISIVSVQEDVSEQDALMAGALAHGSLTAADRVAFSQAAGREQGDMLSAEGLLTPAELSTYTTTLNKLVPTALQNDLTTVQQAVPAGVPLTLMERQGLSPASWQVLTSTWGKGSSIAGTDTASAVLAANQNVAIDAKRRVFITAALGALGLILTLIVTILLARSINRRLTRLRRSALTLAEEQLPSVVARLRRGESVDVAAEAPPLRVGNDEIGQVGQAIDAVRQTAIRSAVEEARLRQGINDVFRNLARRNQSLLQRQLTTLDGMERRATDPDVLEDLFKLDHLTTRMRRHAEGLIILSGSPPGRSWSAPVRLIDVMRGAIAEVEDYARVIVATQSRAAVAGSAVTDVIHLLAELIENATSLSPPFTQVRVSGETVANGFAIEIEDRGLGMTPARLARAERAAVEPAGAQPRQHRAARPVRGRAARQAARHHRHPPAIAVRRHHRGGADPAAADRRGGARGDHRRRCLRLGGRRAPDAPYAPIIMNGSPNGGGYGPMNGSYGSDGGYSEPYSGSYAGSYNGPGAGPYGASSGSYGGNGGSYGGKGSPYPGPNVPRFTPATPAAPAAPAAPRRPAVPGRSRCPGPTSAIRLQARADTAGPAPAHRARGRTWGAGRGGRAGRPADATPVARPRRADSRPDPGPASPGPASPGPASPGLRRVTGPAGTGRRRLVRRAPGTARRPRGASGNRGPGLPGRGGSA